MYGDLAFTTRENDIALDDAWMIGTNYRHEVALYLEREAIYRVVSEFNDQF